MKDLKLDYNDLLHGSVRETVSRAVKQVLLAEGWSRTGTRCKSLSFSSCVAPGDVGWIWDGPAGGWAQIKSSGCIDASDFGAKM